MCSILGILDIKKPSSEFRASALAMSKLQRHRGPDWTGIFADDHVILAHERLAIVDPESGAQPLTSTDDQIVLAVNGEIYNHQDLAKQLKSPYAFKTKSDCEVIIPLYLEHGSDFVDMLQGMFAFILYDKRSHSYLVARDHLGIVPLYIGHDQNGHVLVASEMKAIESTCKDVELFKPGHSLKSGEGLKKYYSRPWMSFKNVEASKTSKSGIKDALQSSVKEHLMTDVPYGVLLSGGLDSSLLLQLQASMLRDVLRITIDQRPGGLDFTHFRLG